MAASSARLRYIGVAMAAGLLFALAPLWLAAQEGPVSVGDHDEHGGILVDAQGMTLYTFDDDEQNVSNCTGECLDQWPALTVQAEDDLAGIDVGVQLGTFEREDTGDLQVTADGLPLYTFVGDGAPGDASGHGLNDVWWVVQVDEAPAEPAAPADDDDGVLDDDDDELPAPAETGNAGLLGAQDAAGSLPQQQEDDDNGNGVTEDDDGITDDDNGVLDDDDDALAPGEAATEEDDDELPAPAETGSAGLVAGSGGSSAGLFLLAAGAALALLGGGHAAWRRMTHRS